eukprot:1161149-Pelagomonas_calceolata.AAC.1
MGGEGNSGGSAHEDDDSKAASIITKTYVLMICLSALSWKDKSSRGTVGKDGAFGIGLGIRYVDCKRVKQWHCGHRSSNGTVGTDQAMALGAQIKQWHWCIWHWVEHQVYRWCGELIKSDLEASFSAPGCKDGSETEASEVTDDSPEPEASDGGSRRLLQAHPPPPPPSG